jgi:general secretion pathway protein E
MPMESRADAGAPVARIELPPGRLVFEQVAMALLADGMVDPADAERLRFSAETMRHDGNIHPLVLLANLKLKAGIAPMGDLGLERLTEWLAARVGLRYLHVDPTRVDVSSVASLVTHAYARRHRILPLAVEPQRLLVATSEPLALEWVGDVRHMARREVEVVLVNPLDLHRYTMQPVGARRNDARTSSAASSTGWAERTTSTYATGCEYSAPATSTWSRAATSAGCAFRIDGMLHKVFEMPPPVMTAVTSRIKVLGAWTW